MNKLPAKAVGEYLYADQSLRVTDLHANVNTAFVAFARGKDSTSGALHLPVSNATQLKTDIATAQAKGVCVLLSIGGANDINGITHGYHLKTTTQINEAVTSLKSLIQTYNFDGVDLDLEDPFNFSPSAVVSVFKQLKTTYPDLQITLASEYFDANSSSGLYRQIAGGLGSAMTCFGVQFYDHSGWTTTTWQSDVTRLVGTLSGLYGAGRVMIGYMRPDDNNLNVSVTQFKNTWSALETKYPALRGGFRWNAKADKASSWEFAVTAGEAIRS